MVPIVPLS